jgi:hypothetical protein
LGAGLLFLYGIFSKVMKSLAFVVLASGCGGEERTNPTAPTVGLPVPLPTGDVSGRIESLETAADLISFRVELTG